MHRYDLSFGQAGLPGSGAYALPSALFILYIYILPLSFYGSVALSVTRLHTLDALNPQVCALTIDNPQV